MWGQIQRYPVYHPGLGLLDQVLQAFHSPLFLNLTAHTPYYTAQQLMKEPKVKLEPKLEKSLEKKSLDLPNCFMFGLKSTQVTVSL